MFYNLVNSKLHKRFYFLLILFVCFTLFYSSNSHSKVVNINESTGYGFIEYDDGGIIEGNFILENDNYSKCNSCVMTFADGNKYFSNLILDNGVYKVTGKVKFVGTIYDYNYHKYNVEINSTAKWLEYGWDYSGEIIIKYNDEEYIFYDVGADDLGESLKLRIMSNPSESKINKNSNNIELATKECKDLGFTEGTEKFADCVLQLSK